MRGRAGEREERVMRRPLAERYPGLGAGDDWRRRCQSEKCTAEPGKDWASCNCAHHIRVPPTTASDWVMELPLRGRLGHDRSVA